MCHRYREHPICVCGCKGYYSSAELEGVQSCLGWPLLLTAPPRLAWPSSLAKTETHRKNLSSPRPPSLPARSPSVQSIKSVAVPSSYLAFLFLHIWILFCSLVCPGCLWCASGNTWERNGVPQWLTPLSTHKHIHQFSGSSSLSLLLLFSPSLWLFLPFFPPPLVLLLNLPVLIPASPGSCSAPSYTALMTSPLFLLLWIDAIRDCLSTLFLSFWCCCLMKEFWWQFRWQYRVINLLLWLPRV